MYRHLGSDESTDCGKNGYPSQAMARKAASRRMRENHSVILRPYLCKACGHWHITSREDRFRPERPHL